MYRRVCLEDICCIGHASTRARISRYQTTQLYSSRSCPILRPVFRSDRRRLSASLRSIEDLVLEVGCLRAGTTSASRTRLRSLSSARSLLRICERSSVTATRTTGPSSSSNLARCVSVGAADVAMFHVRMTLVFEVFACWPPGPPLPEKRHRSSPAGILRDLVTSRSVPGASIGRCNSRSLLARGLCGR